jgi:MYXO-CTERM domain-containing protein
LNRILALVIVVGVALLGAAAPALAYVQTTTTKTNQPMHWNRRSMTVLVYTGEPPADLDAATLVGAASSAAATWSGAAVGCTDIRLSVLSSDEPVAFVAYDGTNRITFRRDEWRKMPCDPAMEDCTPYSAEALAITSVFALEKNGVIVDADMEINAVNPAFRWGDVVRDGQRDHQDIQNVLTHELGHLIGLDHTCYLPDKRPRPRDDKGNLIPDCSAASDEIKQTTMFASADPGDTQKRDLAPDDIAAVCAIYPVAGGGAGGCSVAAGARTAQARGGLAALALAGLLARVRRRRRPRG